MDRPTVEPGPGHSIVVLLGDSPVLRLAPQTALDLAAQLAIYGAARLRLELLAQLRTPEIMPDEVATDEQPRKPGGRRPQFLRCPSCGSPRGCEHDRHCPNAGKEL